MPPNGWNETTLGAAWRRSIWPGLHNRSTFKAGGKRGDYRATLHSRCATFEASVLNPKMSLCVRFDPKELVCLRELHHKIFILI
jgi:hypothetical protein